MFLTTLADPVLDCAADEPIPNTLEVNASNDTTSPQLAYSECEAELISKVSVTSKANYQVDYNLLNLTSRSICERCSRVLAESMRTSRTHNSPVSFDVVLERNSSTDTTHVVLGLLQQSEE